MPQRHSVDVKIYYQLFKSVCVVNNYIYGPFLHNSKLIFFLSVSPSKCVRLPILLRNGQVFYIIFRFPLLARISLTPDFFRMVAVSPLGSDLTVARISVVPLDKPALERILRFQHLILLDAEHLQS